MIVINCLPYQLIQTEVKIVNPAYVMTREQYNSKPCPAVNPQQHRPLGSCSVYTLYAGFGGRPPKFHRARVAKMRARMKRMAKEKVGTSSTNTFSFYPNPPNSIVIHAVKIDFKMFNSRNM